MLKSIIVFIAVLVVLLFALSNVHHIPLHFISGSPFSVRLVYLVLFSYMLGVLSAAYFFFIAKLNARRKARIREATEQEEGEFEL